jgi:transcriptional regulator with XRE-family HTH domain
MRERIATFDLYRFFTALDRVRRSRALRWKVVADEAGVSPSTLTRLSQGKRLDVDSLGSLARWASLEVGAYFRTIH